MMLAAHDSMPVRTRWKTFSAAPHRMMFFGGTVQLVAVMLFWGVELAARYGGIGTPLQTGVPATWAHVFLMLYALFPFFMFGFLMTTYPRWMGGPLVPERSYAGAFLLLAAGVVLFYAGLFLGAPVAAAGALLLLAGWGVGLAALLRVFRHAPTDDKYYERILNAALGAGWLGGLSYLVWLLSEEGFYLNLAIRGGVWLFLVPVLVAVSHRMIPYFSRCVLDNYREIRPGWSLPLLGVGVAGHFALETTGVVQWLFLFDVPLLLLGVHHTVRWGLHRSFQVPLLAVLHIAFLWFAVAMALYSVQSVTFLLTGQYILGKAPLHALGIGFIAGMVIAMATRVTLGHSGRALVLDGYTWACFLGVNGAALVRVAAELSAAAAPLNLVAAVLWLVSVTAWALRYGPMYLRPRVDGKPG